MGWGAIARVCAAAWLLAAAAPSWAAEEPALALDLALENARDRAAATPRFAFTRTIHDHETGAMVTARFDPRRPDDEGWRLVSPPADALDRAHRRVWRRMQAMREADRRMAISEPERLIADDIAFDQIEGARAIFSGGLPAAAMQSRHAQGRAVRESVFSQVFVDTATDQLTGYRVFAPEPFRPNPAARITTFERTAQIAEAWPGGPLVERFRTQTVAGSALFFAIARNETVTNEASSPVD